tara:strand:- start:1055 stop:1165 length:111 start_codon:yes stop_codon:yes gene_type:complete
LLTAENIDSAKKTLPIEMPYMPPAREFLIYISTECA